MPLTTRKYAICHHRMIPEVTHGVLPFDTLVSMGWWRAVLEGAVSEEKLDQVSFVRLEPVQLDRLDPANVQPVDVIRIEQLLAELGIFRDRCADQCGANGLDRLILRAFDNRSKGEHVLGIREFGFGRRAVNDRREQVFGLPQFPDAVTAMESRTDIG